MKDYGKLYCITSEIMDESVISHHETIDEAIAAWAREFVAFAVNHRARVYGTNAVMRLRAPGGRVIDYYNGKGENSKAKF
jgi:hypothetical protein